MSSATTHHLYPPFPSDLPTAPLDSISLHKLQASSPDESSRLFASCRNIGFIYLELLGSELGEALLQEAEELHKLQQKFFALPHEDKDEYGQDKIDPFFSYRYSNCSPGSQDVWLRPGRREMYSLRADDFLNVRPALAKHPMVASAEPLFASFTTHCRQVVRLLLEILEQHLLLPAGSLLDLHLDNVASGDFITLQHRAAEPSTEAMVQKGEHTDFGSITLLWNWLGGLQIRDQSKVVDHLNQWLYVKPVPGAIVVNLADSLVKLTSGLLKSNIHRVAPAPGAQSGLPRYSLVYFAHPNDSVELKPVKGGLVDSATIAREEESITAADWVTRRSLGDLRGVYTWARGIEPRDNNDAVPTPHRVKVKA